MFGRKIHAVLFKHISCGRIMKKSRHDSVDDHILDFSIENRTDDLNALFQIPRHHIRSSKEHLLIPVVSEAEDSAVL